MSESFEQYKNKNMPGGDKTARTSNGPMTAIANSGWNFIPWPHKDLAKGGKSLRAIGGKGVKFGRNHDRPMGKKMKKTS